MNATIVRRPSLSAPELTSALRPKYGNYSELFASILTRRDINSTEELSTLMADLAHYRAFKGMSNAVDALANAIINQQKIVIVGDFDADGATSTAVCMLALRAMGAQELDFVVPNRFDFGYGLSPQIVEVAAHQYDAQLIVTVDNGISCIEGVNKANELGVSVVITDHHLPGPTLPNATAIVNPNQHDCAFLSKHSAGVAVAFYVMTALRAELSNRQWFNSTRPQPNMAELLDLVAVGTVADVVQLDRNNRILVHQGLQRIRAGRCRPGIMALCEVAGKELSKLLPIDLGFIIGPRLNAAGRLDDMNIGIRCLLAESDDEAKHFAQQLDALNRERRSIEQDMRDIAESTLQSLDLSEKSLPKGIVLFDPSFHQGVIGIVAGRIKEQYYRPTFVFAQADEGELKGSARSIPGIHIRDILEQVHSHYPGVIKKFGGHAMAAGLSLHPDALDEFKQALQQVLSAHFDAIPDVAQIDSDGPLDPRHFSVELAQQLNHLCVWGQGCPEPVFDNEFTILQQRIVGENHLKLLLQCDGETIDAIAFNVDTSVWPNPNCRKVHAAYRLSINEFRGRTSVQCMVVALHPL